MRGVKRNAADAALDAAANAGAGAGAGAGVDASAAAAPASGAAAGLELQGGGGAGDDADQGHDGGGGGGGDEGDGLGPMGDDDNLEDDDDDDGGLDDGSLVGAHPDAGLSGDGAGSASGGGGGGGGITVHHKPHNFRRKINIEFIEDRNRRHITFSKRKAGIMKKVRGGGARSNTAKARVPCPRLRERAHMACNALHVWQAYELSTLTGTQVLLLVASETGHVYTFATPKLQPLITKPEGKNLIQACLNTPDLPSAGLPVPVRCAPARPQHATRKDPEVCPLRRRCMRGGQRLSHGYDQPAVDNSALGDANEKMTVRRAPRLCAIGMPRPDTKGRKRPLRVNQPGMLYNAYPGVAVGGMYVFVTSRRWAQSHPLADRPEVVSRSCTLQVRRPAVRRVPWIAADAGAPPSLWRARAAPVAHAGPVHAGGPGRARGAGQRRRQPEQEQGPQHNAAWTILCRQRIGETSARKIRHTDVDMRPREAARSQTVAWLK